MIRTPGPSHLEDRSMSSASNPYLALSVYVMAGLDGIRRKLDPGEPNLGNMYSLGLEEINAGVHTYSKFVSVSPGSTCAR